MKAETKKLTAQELAWLAKHHNWMMAKYNNNGALVYHHAPMTETGWYAVTRAQINAWRADHANIQDDDGAAKCSAVR